MTILSRHLAGRGLSATGLVISSHSGMTADYLGIGIIVEDCFYYVSLHVKDVCGNLSKLIHAVCKDEVHHTTWSSLFPWSFVGSVWRHEGSGWVQYHDLYFLYQTGHKSN